MKQIGKDMIENFKFHLLNAEKSRLTQEKDFRI